MSGRLRRSSGNAKKDALARIAEAKKGGRRQLDDLDLEEEMVYDEVSEEEYRRIVSDRRDGDSFVVDGGLGYADDGEEDWDANDPGQDEAEYAKKHAALNKRGRRRKLPSAAPAPPPKRVSNAFLRSKRAKERKEKAPEDSESLLNNLLQGIREDPTGEGSTDDDEDENRPQNLEESALYQDSIREEHDGLMKQRVENKVVSSAPMVKPKAPVAPTPSVAAPPAVTHDANDNMDLDLEDPVPVATEADSSAIPDQRPAASSNAPTLPSTSPTPSPEKQGTVEPVPVRELPPVENDADMLGTDEGTDWKRIVEQTQADSKTAHAQAPTVGRVSDLLDDNGELTLFWLDAREEPWNCPGRIYLFGKALVPGTTDKFVSCCVLVNNMERNLYVLPRSYHVQDPRFPKETQTDEAVGIKDVYNEIRGACSKLGIRKWKSKVATRKYAFENEDGDIPAETQYLKLVYSAEFPTLPRDTKGKSFSHVFGSASSCMELFLLKRQLKGPGWLRIKGAVPHSAQHSWCKAEFEVGSHKLIEKMSEAPEPPPLTVLSLSLQCHFNPRTHSNEIVALSGLVHESVSIDLPTVNADNIKHFSAVRNVHGGTWPMDLSATIDHRKLKVHCCANERSLLSFALARIGTIDPDVIVGHNLYGFGLDVLLHRCNIFKIAKWSRLSRLRRNKLPRLRSGGSFNSAVSAVGGGRLFCDTQSSAKELLRQTTYTLSHLSRELLRMPRTEVDSAEIPNMFRSTNGILQMTHHCENDAFLTLRLMFHLMILPLTKQLTCLGGNLWSRSLQSSRAERIEYLLLHEFHRLKYIVPEKYTSRERKEKMAADGENVANGKRKPAYSGGLVLEPKKGFYDKFILLLDFNSLYPSIIQEYNLCFTTVQHWDLDENGLASLPGSDAEAGILPRVIKTLVERRRSVKSLLKKARDPIKRQQYDIRQQALKLVANSMYGCLGFSQSRFYCKPIAALVTTQGRHILQATVTLTNNMGHDVIYGDTDSIMVNTGQADLAAVRGIGAQIKKEVNQQYKTLEIEIDGVFSSMLLLQKKKYAALVVNEKDGRITTTRELKGIDMVRRDWCPLSKHVGEYVIGQILSGRSRDDVINNIHEFLQQTADRVAKNLVPLGQYVITKSISKMPKDYPNRKTLPHVNVAHQMIQKGMPIRIGDHIPYVICEGKESSAALRAHHPSELSQGKDKNLAIDTKWYLSQQVLPPIARLCMPMEGTNISAMAECLGLDRAAYRSMDVVNTTEEDQLEVAICLRNLDDDEAFKDVVRLQVACPFCSTPRTFSGVLNFQSNRMGLLCPNAKCSGVNLELKMLAQLRMALRESFVKQVARYNEYWMLCHDSACCHRFRQPNPFGKLQCAKCQGPVSFEYPESALFMQLRYFESLFDVERTKRRIEVENKARIARNRGEVMLSIDLNQSQHNVYSSLKRFVEKTMLQSSSYYYLQAEDVFKVFQRLNLQGS